MSELQKLTSLPPLPKKEPVKLVERKVAGQVSESSWARKSFATKFKKGES